MSRKKKAEDNISNEKIENITKLKNQLKKLEKQNRKLISEIRTLEVAFEETINYLSETVDGRSVEEIVANKDICPYCKKKGSYRRGVPFGEIVLCKYCDHREVIKNGT
jgi:DNA repair exonuclease SbcCD ATPase subunit